MQAVSEIDWRHKHHRALDTYCRCAPHFDEVSILLENEYADMDAEPSPADFNNAIIRAISSYLGFTPSLIRAQDPHALESRLDCW